MQKLNIIHAQKLNIVQVQKQILSRCTTRCPSHLPPLPGVRRVDCSRQYSSACSGFVIHIIPFNLTRNTLSLEEAGIVEGVSWMNYFLVIFIALPLASLLTVKVTQTIKISSLSLFHRWHTTGWSTTEGWKFQNENMYLKHSAVLMLSLVKASYSTCLWNIVVFSNAK